MVPSKAGTVCPGGGQEGFDSMGAGQPDRLSLALELNLQGEPG